MNILDNVIILLLIVGAFLAGMKISDRYHREIENNYEYSMKIMSAEKGLGYVNKPGRVPIGQPFMDKLKGNGRAIQQINSANTNAK